MDNISEDAKAADPVANKRAQKSAPEEHDGFDNVMYEISATFKPRNTSEVKVIINPQKRTVVTRLQASLFNRPYKYYLILNNENPLNKSRGSFVYTYVEDPPRSRFLDIDISYAASCARGDEKRFARSLYDELGPVQVLKKLLTKWICEYAQVVGHTFIDSFMEQKSELEAAIKFKAREAGISLSIGLSTDSSQLHLEPYERLLPFEIQTEDSEREFETKVSQNTVKLNIVVNTRLRDLSKVKYYRDSGRDVPKEMKAEIISVTARLLRKTDPERFYFDFVRQLSHRENNNNQTNGHAYSESVVGERLIRYLDNHASSKNDLEHEIIEEITEALDRKFNADVLDVVLRPESTAITEVEAKLEAAPGQFKVKVSPLDIRQPYDIEISGRFRVKSLNRGGWKTFRSSLPEVNQIKECIERRLGSELQNSPEARIDFRNPEEWRELTNVIFNAARNAVLNDFGLEIDVSDIQRELNWRDEGWKKLVKDIESQIIELEREKIQCLVTDSEDIERIEEIERKINVLRRSSKGISGPEKPMLPGAVEIKSLPASAMPGNSQDDEY